MFCEYVFAIMMHEPRTMCVNACVTKCKPCKRSIGWPKFTTLVKVTYLDLFCYL